MHAKEPRLWVCFEINTPITLNTAVQELSLSTGHTAPEVQIPSADIQQESYITGINEVIMRVRISICIYISTYY